MSIVRARRSRSAAGFTLVEIIVAVAIFGMMSVAIYRFVQSSILAMRVAAETSAADSKYVALRDLLSAQWQSLPQGGGNLSGEPLKLGDRSRDEIRWTCGAGPGLLTRYAPGDFIVSMRMQPEKNGSDKWDLGLLRKPKDDTSVTDVQESWFPLVENVQSFQVRYFDNRINAWTERWTDTVTLPRLVKVIIGRSDSAVPWEATIPLARTAL